MFVGFNYYRLQTKKLILHLYNISIDNAERTLDFDNMRLVTRSVRGGHDSECRDVADRTHGRYALPGGAEHTAHRIHKRHYHNVHMETAALL